MCALIEEEWQAYDPDEAEDYAVVQSKADIERVSDNTAAFRPRRQLAAYAKQHVRVSGGLSRVVSLGVVVVDV